jgi:amino acid adenylation domain-containing protein
MVSVPVLPGIGERLSLIAERLPRKCALVERDCRIDYARLDANTRAVARQVNRSMPGRPGFAGLLFERKAPAVQAMFGVLRAGSAFVPLDAGDPDERLRSILHDSNPGILLTETALCARARALAGPGCPVVDIDLLEPAADTPPLPAVAPRSRAYLLYTSGSTGQPKGVSQNVENLLFFSDAYAKTLRMAESDRLSLVFVVNFAASLMHIFGGLLRGATLCAYDMRRDGIPLLADWLEREQVTLLHTIPSVFRELCQRLPADAKLSHLRGIDLAGEAAFASDVAMFRRHTLEHCILVNQLGATEADVIAQHVVTHDSPQPPSAILPVGRSPEGVRVYIRRPDGSMAAPNEVGAIVVASPHVSPGYWNRPELDAVAFAPDPLRPDARCYVSGDMGYLDGNTDLHFVGRQGSRVKIRGHSVDLMEVEAALTACPGVQRAAVLASVEDPHREADRLVAYVVVGPGVSPDAVVLRDRLALRVPPYMIPSAFQFLKALPVTASGKIDRKMLASLEPARTHDLTREETARDDLEMAIAGIFQRVVKCANVGRDDNFFLLGGDSLRMVDLQTRLRETFGVDVKDFHHNPTVAGAAAAIRRQRSSSRAAANRLPVLIPLRESGNAPPLFLVHGRLPQALVSPQFLTLLGSDQPVWAFQARGLDGVQTPHATLESMAEDYVREMRRVRPRGPYFLGAMCIGGFIAVEMARLLRRSGESVLPLLLLDPPSFVFAMRESTVTEAGMLKRLQRRHDAGIIDAPLDDSAYLRASVRTAQAFETAIRRYRPQPYDGPVFMLSSRARIMASGNDDLRRLFTGRLERFEVTVGHTEILDPHNPRFVAALAECVARIRATVVTA